jgi:hypothetical protein
VLIDQVVAQRYPLNRTGERILQLVDGRRTVGDIASQIAAEAHIGFDQALQDVSGFLQQLGDGLLLNERFELHVYWKLALVDPRLLIGELLGAIHLLLTQRLRQDFVGAARANMLVLLAVMARFIAATCWPSMLLLVVGVMATLLAVGVDALVTPKMVALLGAALFGSTLLHEYCHLVALRAVAGPPVRAFIAVQGMGLGVHHGPLPKRQSLLVTLAGPLGAGVPGLALLWLAAETGSLALLLVGLIFAVHVLSLTPLGHDGRQIQRLLDYGTARRKPRAGAELPRLDALSYAVRLVAGATIGVVAVVTVGMALSIAAAQLDWPAFVVGAAGDWTVYELIHDGELRTFKIGLGGFLVGLAAGLVNTTAGVWLSLRSRRAYSRAMGRVQ